MIKAKVMIKTTATLFFVIYILSHVNTGDENKSRDITFQDGLNHFKEGDEVNVYASIMGSLYDGSKLGSIKLDDEFLDCISAGNKNIGRMIWEREMAIESKYKAYIIKLYLSQKRIIYTTLYEVENETARGALGTWQVNCDFNNDLIEQVYTLPEGWVAEYEEKVKN